MTFNDDNPMKKIGVVFEDRFDSRYGVFNAVINRVKHLREAMAGEAIIDVWMLYLDHNRLSRLIHGERSADVAATAVIDGIEINVLRHRLSVTDAVRQRFHCRPADYEAWCRSLMPIFASYDLLTVHDLLPAMLARVLNKRYCVTWHGTSINTTPWREPLTRQLTVECLAGAWHNFTVSDAMGTVAQQLCPTARVSTLHNGANSSFVKVSETERNRWRADYGVMPDDKIMVFVGRHVEDKKVLLLPEIYHRTRELYAGRVVFWSIGDGPLLRQLQQSLPAGTDVVYMGKQPADAMPRLLSCADVMVLPSRMEGLPLVAAEALATGCHVVASRVGGTPEVVGIDNTFPLDTNFTEAVATRAAAMMRGEVTQELPPDISWTATAARERAFYLS